ncbi:MAG: histidine phosphatase family protein [Limnohabitans sp.]|nr:histidine phosphatase family protein [Limnohabitans sp.]
MKVTRISAIRHGETAWNVDTRIQGQLDIPLNATGQWQAEQVGRALSVEKIDAIYCSDLLRAHHTAIAIGKAVGIEPVTTPMLRERDFGKLQGKTWAEIETYFPNESRMWKSRQPDWQPDGGESLLQMIDRIEHAANTLAAPHEGQHIVWVAHGGVLDILYRLATGQHLQAPRTWSLRNTAINRLMWVNQKLQMVGWGDEAHLDNQASFTPNNPPADAGGGTPK